jgi:hypothetical protein
MKTRKELKNEYKEMKFTMGVFQIRNTVNNKIFIESSNDLKAIWNRHRFQLNFGNHPNEALQQEWKEYGEDKFSYEILGEIKHTETPGDYSKEIKLLEKMYIEELQPYDEKGYHLRSKK